MQEQFIDHAVEGPETRHPKLGSDMVVNLQVQLFAQFIESELNAAQA